jgi:hypothetical protein
MQGMDLAARSKSVICHLSYIDDLGYYSSLV